MKYRTALHAPLIQAAADRDWEMAEAIQVTPSSFEGEQDHIGVLIARPHATGWFVSARCRPGLDPETMRQFKRFVARNSYILFQQGPLAGAWAPGTVTGEWRAFIDAETRDLDVEIPETIPSQWAA